MKKRLGDLLVDAGLINDDQLSAGLGEQKQWGGKLGSVLISKGFISEADLLKVLARQMGVGYVSMWREGIDIKAVRMIKPEVAIEHKLFPFAVDEDTITVGMTDPRNLHVTDDIQFTTGRKLKPVLAALEEIELAIRKYYDRKEVQDWEFENLAAEMDRKKHAPIPKEIGQTVEIGENGAVEVEEEQFEAPDPSQVPAQHMALLSEKKQQRKKTKRSPIIIEKTLVSLINVLIRNGVISKEELVEEMKEKK